MQESITDFKVSSISPSAVAEEFEVAAISDCEIGIDRDMAFDVTSPGVYGSEYSWDSKVPEEPKIQIPLKQEEGIADKKLIQLLSESKGYSTPQGDPARLTPLKLLTIILVRHPLALVIFSCILYSSMLFISFNQGLFEQSEQELRDYLVQSHQTTIDYVKKVAAEDEI